MGKSIRKIIEDFGFKVEKDKDGWSIQCYTPAGEDWWLYFNNLKDVKEYAETYDPEGDFETLYEAGRNGFKGVPGPGELWKDQLWKKKTLNKIASKIEKEEK